MELSTKGIKLGHRGWRCEREVGGTFGGIRRATNKRHQQRPANPAPHHHTTSQHHHQPAYGGPTGGTRSHTHPVRGIDPPHTQNICLDTYNTVPEKNIFFSKKYIFGPKVAITIRSLCPLSNAPKGGSFGPNCDCNIGPFSTAIKMQRQQCRNHN